MRIVSWFEVFRQNLFSQPVGLNYQKKCVDRKMFLHVSPRERNVYYSHFQLISWHLDEYLEQVVDQSSAQKR